MTKYLLFLLTILFSCESTDLSLEQAYNHATTKLDPELNDVLLKHDELLASQGNGPAIFLKSKIDTIESNNDYAGYSDASQLGQAIWIAATAYDGAELKISIGQIFGNQFIEHKVHNRKISTEFSEDYKDDDLVKLKKDDQPTNKLLIPLVVAEVKLSKTAHFKAGELIYGKAKVVTQPYYLKEPGYEFDCIKREYEYYFKCKIRMDQR
ncbi:hypothetical protein [Haliscomenobacter sp.]|uniref:hypothetical protein n=1 Tax=Haliscomenobacter sp. TaxID=2717303 RepID=UPI00359422EF